MAGPDGVHDADGINTDEKLNFILDMRAKDPMHCKPYAEKFGCEFVEGTKHCATRTWIFSCPPLCRTTSIWSGQEDCRVRREVLHRSRQHAHHQRRSGVPARPEAHGRRPSKAVNAGGAGVSALEMSQNSERLVWTAEEVDAQLKKMMVTIHSMSAEAAEEYGLAMTWWPAPTSQASRRLPRP